MTLPLRLVLKELSDYHDLLIVGIKYDDKERTLHLYFESTCVSSEIRLLGCEYFRVVDFVPRSVVSRLITISGKTSSEGAIEDEAIWVTSLEDSASYLNQEGLSRIIGAVKSGEASIFRLEPSWGAEVVAICREILIGA